jgi:hypothetical protein
VQYRSLWIVAGAAAIVGRAKWVQFTRPPSHFGASAYAFLASLLWVPLEMPLKAHARTYPQLEAYCRRMKSRYYPEGVVTQ